LATGSEVVFLVEQGGDALHFTGQCGSDFQFAKNHRAGFGAAPRCHRIFFEYGFDASQTETNQGALFRISSGSGASKALGA
jgi:hypothetical protein